MERWLEAQLLFENGYEDIGADRDPYLGLHRIGRGAEERLDPQVLFDPLEEQLHLPAHLVELCDYVCGQRHVVGQKDEEAQLVFVVETDPAQVFRIHLKLAAESPYVVRPDAGRGIDWLRAVPDEIEVLLRPDDEESRVEMHEVEAREV